VRRPPSPFPLSIPPSSPPHRHTPPSFSPPSFSPPHPPSPHPTILLPHPPHVRHPTTPPHPTPPSLGVAARGVPERRVPQTERSRPAPDMADMAVKSMTRALGSDATGGGGKHVLTESAIPAEALAVAAAAAKLPDGWAALCLAREDAVERLTNLALRLQARVACAMQAPPRAALTLSVALSPLRFSLPPPPPPTAPHEHSPTLHTPPLLLGSRATPAPPASRSRAQCATAWRRSLVCCATPCSSWSRPSCAGR
jgi:hypothetical protein